MLTLRPIIALALAASLGLSGCATLEPAYVRPPLPTSDRFPQAEAAASPAAGGPASTAASAAAIAWKDFFLDLKLREVINIGLSNNRDLRTAILNIQAAKAQYRVQNANLLPRINASAGAEYARESAAELGPVQPGEANHYDLNIYSATVGTSNYEVDLFGRLRSLSKAAFEQYLATREARRASQIAIVAEIASDYMTLAADEAMVKTAEATVASSQQSVDLAQQRMDRGVASALDVRQAETVLDQARSDVASATTAVAQDQNALNLVVGSAVPEALLPAPLDDRLMVRGALPPALPSTVLLQRPDVLQAEHQLKAANAEIGAARAAFFPSISLTASGGGVSANLATLFKGASGVWTFEPEITLPLFAGGANRANLDYARTERRVEVAAYEKAIQTAFREVADALARRATINDQLAAQEANVAAADAALQLSQARYRRGADTYLNVLIAERTLYAAQQNLTSARLIRSTNLISLYQALGGGDTPLDGQS